jgi:hypothetical protein
MLGHVALLIALLSAPPDTDEWPKETIFKGPATFCGWKFSVKVSDSEQVVVRDGGLDFLVYFFEEGPAQYTIYEGNHPEQWGKPEAVNAGLGLPTTQMWKNNRPSYLVKVAERPITHFLHIMSGTFDGSQRDFKLLKSIKYGDAANCTKPTYDKRP